MNYTFGRDVVESCLYVLHIKNIIDYYYYWLLQIH